jgi:hypothetical protein
MLAVAGVFIIWNSFTGMGRLWRVVVAVIGFATPVLAYYGSLHPFPTFPNDRGLIFAGIAALVVLVWFAYLAVAHPERIRAAAQHADQHQGVPPLDENLDLSAAGRVRTP